MEVILQGNRDGRHPVRLREWRCNRSGKALRYRVLDMKVMVVGAGEVGFHIAELLAENGMR